MPVGRAPQRQPAVAAPRRERGAVELGVDRGFERARSSRARTRVDRGSSATCASVRTSRTTVTPPGATQSIRAVVTGPVDRDVDRWHERAELAVLLPEVLAVHELDREPEGVVPRMVGRRVDGQDASVERAQRVHVGRGESHIAVQGSAIDGRLRVRRGPAPPLTVGLDARSSRRGGRNCARRGV